MFSNVIDLLFNCTCFIYIGMVIPFSEWSNVHTSVSLASRVCLFAWDALLIRSSSPR
jgi:NhaP-type Na+/H+ or K+/H+ antiporter